MTPRTSTSYREWLKQDLGALIEALELSDLQKHFLRSRWLDQVLFRANLADGTRNRYYALRLTTIIGGVIIPALVSLNVSGEIASAIRWITFGLSLLVAISAVVEEFFHYGRRWLQYRSTFEWLKIEGWQFFQLGGPYRRYKSHDEAYSAFATRVEDIIQRDVEVFAEVAREKEVEEKKPGK